MKRLLSLLLVCLLISTCIGGFTANATEITVSPGGTFPITNEKITLTAWLEGGAEKDWPNNGWLKEMEERTNVWLEIIPSSAADALDKRNLLLASGNYPDMFLTDWNAIFTQSDVLQFGIKEGILKPITPYLENYGFEINQIFDYNPNFKASSTAPDGEIYGVARFTECFHCTAYPKIYMRQDWLDKLALKQPETTEELREVLRAFVNNDPNGNGAKDEIGITAATTWNTPIEFALLGTSFLPVKPDFWMYLEGGEVKFAPDKDAYRDGLRYIKSLYDEGLIDPAAFSQKDDQMAMTIRQDPPIVGAYVCDHVGMGVQNSNYAEYKNYQIMLPVAGPSGYRVQPQNANEGEVAGFQGVITDACKYPEAAFRVLDYFLSESSYVEKHWGKKGLAWDDAAPGTKTIFDTDAKFVAIQIPDDDQAKKDENALYQMWGGPIGDIAPRRASQLVAGVDPYLPENYEVRISLDTIPLQKFFRTEFLPSKLYIPVDQADEYNELQVNLKDFVRKTMVQFIIGNRDLETGWDQYLTELKSFGSDRYLEIYSGVYTSTVAK